jgi:phage-related protein
MEVFPNFPPHKGTSRSIEPRILRAEFGDGYSQRLAGGLNAVIDEWQVSWVNLPVADADTIDDFLRQKKGVESFQWTPPRETAAKLFTCAKWSREPSLPGADTISATFRQEFDLII